MCFKSHFVSLFLSFINTHSKALVPRDHIHKFYNLKRILNFLSLFNHLSLLLIFKTRYLVLLRFAFVITQKIEIDKK